MERFTSLARNTAGSGLGLAIVRAVADSHGAELRLETSRAGGLRVVLSFPLAARADDGSRRGAVAAIVLAGCMAFGGGADAQSRTLTIFSAPDALAMEPLIAGFEARNPDVDVEYREFQTVDLHRALVDGAPEVRPDVVVSSAMGLQVDLVNRGLAHRLDLVEAAALPGWAAWRSELFGFTYEPAAIVYNEAAFDGVPLPSSHRELVSRIRAAKTGFAAGSEPTTYASRASAISTPRRTWYRAPRRSAWPKCWAAPASARTAAPPR